MPAYARPTRLDDALELLARRGPRVLAGGTDYYPSRVGRPADDDVLDLSAVRALRGIHRRGDHWRIGATTTWSDLRDAQLPPLFDGLRGAAREIGGRQIQNRGTLAGNLCNASPAADGVPVLLTLQAAVELASARGSRTLPLSQFIIGPRRTVLAGDELVRAIRVPVAPRTTVSGFLKLGARKHLVISIAMVAAVIEHDGGVVRAARIAVGACSPVARRLPRLEEALVGKRLGAELARCVRREYLDALAPIDDHRASAAYRRHAAQTLLQRLLAAIA